MSNTKTYRDTEILNAVYDETNRQLKTNAGGGGTYSATPPTYTDGQTVTAQYDSNGNAKVTLATALSQAIDSVLTYSRGSNSTVLSASGLALTTAGKLTALFVSTASTIPTIKVWDSTTASGTVIIDTFTPVAGQIYRLPDIRVGTGIYITISGTVTVTVCYDPTTT